MKLPADSPQWISNFVEALEGKAHDMLDKAKSADEALRAAGAFSLLKYASAELEIEASRQESEARAVIAKFNDRSGEPVSISPRY